MSDTTKSKRKFSIITTTDEFGKVSNVPFTWEDGRNWAGILGAVIFLNMLGLHRLNNPPTSSITQNIKISSDLGCAPKPVKQLCFSK